MSKQAIFDVIIVGGSFSGLSAAMTLGRALRSVLILDTTTPCNRQTLFSHNFILHDGESPAQISKKALEQVLCYPTVTYKNEAVVKTLKESNSFQVETESEMYSSKRLILATGFRDELPPIDGLSECWGISALHCPYCHGYEVAGKKTAILENGDHSLEMCIKISNWTDKMVLITNGPSTITPEHYELIMKKNIEIIEKPIEKLIHQNGSLQKIIFVDGSEYEVDVIYLRSTPKQASSFAEQLGCELSKNNEIIVDGFQQTSVKGVFAGGDATILLRTVAIAVASGQKAGFFVNKEIMEENFMNP